MAAFLHIGMEIYQPNSWNIYRSLQDERCVERMARKLAAEGRVGSGCCAIFSNRERLQTQASWVAVRMLRSTQHGLVL